MTKRPLASVVTLGGLAEAQVLPDGSVAVAATVWPPSGEDVLLISPDRVPVMKPSGKSDGVIEVVFERSTEVVEVANPGPRMTTSKVSWTDRSENAAVPAALSVCWLASTRVPDVVLKRKTVGRGRPCWAAKGGVTLICSVTWAISVITPILGNATPGKNGTV